MCELFNSLKTMPKRKRTTVDIRPNKRRRKNSKSSTLNEEHNELNIKLPQRGKRQIVPKSALKYLKNPLDHLIFFKLLSKTKRPFSKFEWDLMAQTFIHNGSKHVNGQTLYDFYSILVQNGSILDTEFLNNKNNKNNNKSNNKNKNNNDHNSISYYIDFACYEYKNAYKQFIDKL
eukprot:12154_1